MNDLKAQLWSDLSRLLSAYDAAESEEARERLANDYDELRERLLVQRIEGRSPEAPT